MGPAEAELVKDYGKIHNKFFPPAKPTIRPPEIDYGPQILALQSQVFEATEALDKAQSKIVDLEGRVAFIESLLKPECVEDSHDPKFKRVTVKDIVKAVCHVEGSKRYEIVGPYRDRKTCEARHIIYYLCCSLTLLGMPAIGRLLNRDHTTILHGKRRIEKLITTIPAFQSRIARYEADLLASAE